MTKQEKDFVERPDAMAIVCGELATGSSLQTICEQRDLARGVIWLWIARDVERLRLYNEARAFVRMGETDRLVEHARAIVYGDIRYLLDSVGRVRPVSEWPAELAAGIVGLDVDEIFGKGKDAEVLEGLAKKIKLADRRAWAELLLKIQGLYTDKVQHTHSLEQIVAGAGE